MSQYNEKFYDTISDGSVRSALTVAPMILDRIYDEENVDGKFKVIDVGCGEGHWGAAFEDLGCEVFGLDGSYVNSPRIPFRAHNLEQALPDDLDFFDLAVCLEVAEHLTEARAASFIHELGKLSDTVLFSAAIPFQTGTGHINCQWQSYWKELFEAEGFNVTDDIRSDIWMDKRIEVWYRQNMMLCQRGYRLKASGVFDVVHPEMHYWGRV